MADMEQKAPKIVYEDGQVLVVYKPNGWLTVGKSMPDQPSLEEWLIQEQKNLNGLDRAGIAHRLDRETSGGVMVGKTKESLEFLKKKFKTREIVKKYYCLVDGEITGEGRIEMPLGEYRTKYVFKRKIKVGGKGAVTEFKRLGVGECEGRKYSLVEVRIFTGRTHQIRVHLSYLGWPIVGDKWYGRTGEDRLMLHERYLSWEDSGGVRREVKIEMPLQMKEILKKYGLKI